MADTLETLEKKLHALDQRDEETTGKVDLLIEILEALRSDDPRRSLAVSEDVYALSERLSYRRGMGYGLGYMGFAHNMLSNLETAYARLQEAIPLLEEIGDEDGRAMVLAELAGVHLSLGNYDQALGAGIQALKILQQTGNRLQQAWTLNGFGIGYTEFGVYDRALEFYEEALALFEDEGERVGEARALNGIGTIYHRQGAYEQALPYHVKCLKIFQEEGNHLGEARALNDLGVIYHPLGDDERALPYHLESLTIREALGVRQPQSTSLIHLGTVYLQQDEIDKALDVLHRALVIAEDIKGKPRIYQAHQGLAEAYERRGDLAEALDHHKAFQQGREAVQGEEVQAKITTLNTRFEVEKAEQEAEIERLRNVELKQKNEELARLLQELKTTQAQLIQAEKMASLGQLTAGIAHEIQNPLNFVNNFSHLSVELAQELSEELEAHREQSVGEVLDGVLADLDDHLHEQYRLSRTIPGLAQAYRMMHRPADADEPLQARRRLALDELLLLQLGVMLKRRHRRLTLRAPAMKLTKAIDRHIVARFPFDLTASQRSVIDDIATDLCAATPMNRLLQGDVGAGKTVVALYGMLMAVASGHQAAIMAPTELLAEQHGASIGRMLDGTDVTTAVLTGSLTTVQRRTILERLEAGEIDLLIGTHALLTERVRFKSLALAVIDEQHRFGVEQRAALIGKGTTPDVLLLSATPIPRSLALTMYGDLDMSVLRKRPPGRGDVRTEIRTGRRGESVVTSLRERCGRGGQAYVVLPVIEESERVDLRAATTMAETLSAELAELTIGLVHGRLKAEERDAIMRQFRAGEIDVLVATTVIEVGIDVANATTMVIHHPERFGLAQLHQLRGRIGRGGDDSVCVLMVDGTVPPRLESFARTTDGFRIAELDLAERGMGDLIGARQSGGFVLRHAKLPEDAELLERARQEARGLIEKDPGLTAARHQGLRERAVRRYPRAAELFRVG